MSTPKVEIKTVGFVALETGKPHVYTQKNNKRRAERQHQEKLEESYGEKLKKLQKKFNRH